MQYLITSDTHLGHHKIIEYGRPMNYMERIYKWFGILKSDDVLIHLWDFCIGRDAHWHEEFKAVDCKKILVRGNHDHKSITWYMNNGWDFVCDGFNLRYGSKNILFTHKPKCKSESFDLNIHGHFHTMERPERIAEFKCEYDTNYHKLISLEKNNYQLTNLQSLIWQKK